MCLREVKIDCLVSLWVGALQMNPIVHAKAINQHCACKPTRRVVGKHDINNIGVVGGKNRRDVIPARLQAQQHSSSE